MIKGLQLVAAFLLFSLSISAQMVAQVGTITVTGGATGNESFAHGLGETPKVLLLWTTNPGDSGRSTNDFTISFGAAISSTERRAVWAGSKDLVDPSDAMSRSTESKVLIIYDGQNPATAVGEADFVSFDSTNFTLNRTTAFTSNTPVTYMAIGGSDLNNQKLVTFAQPAATGTFDTTSVGFQGDFLFLFSTNATALDTNTADGSFSIGFTDGTNAGLHTVHNENGATNSDTRSYIRSAASQLEIWARLVGTASSALQRNSFDSFLSNGFKLNAIETTGSATQIFALTLKGGSYFVGDFLTQASTGEFSETGVGFQGSGMFAIVDGEVAAQSTIDTAHNHARGSFGAATGASEDACHWAYAQDNRPSNNNKRNNRSTARVFADFTNTAVLRADADFVSFDSDGWTWNTTTAEIARFGFYFVLGDAVSAPTRRPVTVY